MKIVKKTPLYRLSCNGIEIRDSLTLLVTACGACAACDGFGFARNTAATTFDIFYWLQVTNFDVLLNSAPSGPDYIDILGLSLHA